MFHTQKLNKKLSANTFHILIHQVQSVPCAPTDQLLPQIRKQPTTHSDTDILRTHIYTGTMDASTLLDLTISTTHPTHFSLFLPLFLSIYFIILKSVGDPARREREDKKRWKKPCKRRNDATIIEPF
jgi:hypothetical protein